MPEKNTNIEKQQRAVKAMVASSGFALIVIGLTCLLVAPEQIATFADTDVQTIKYIGMALMIFGAIEAFIVPRALFRNNERK